MSTLLCLSADLYIIARFNTRVTMFICYTYMYIYNIYVCVCGKYLQNLIPIMIHHAFAIVNLLD